MKKRSKKLFTSFGVVLVAFLGVAIFLYLNVHTVQVSGVSMLPTLKNGQRVLVTKAYWLPGVGPISRKDIVVLRDTSPGALPGAYIIKRVQYLPGDTVPFFDEPKYRSFAEGPLKIDPGYLYVMGDNLPQSEDSREFGPVASDNVLGKVVVWR